MRKKIKELMNKEEGFTLVELLAVIVILGIILAIAVPGIGRVIDNAQTESDEAEEQLIIEAGRMYFLSDKKATESETFVGTVTVPELVSGGYLEKTVSEVNENGTVTRTDDTPATYTFAP